MRLLVTGATGFIGRAVLEGAGRDPALTLWGASRSTQPALPAGVQAVRATDLGPDNDWRAALQGITAIVHASARVHVLRENAADPLAEFRRANVAGTLNLATQAVAAGVRRFVFISSVGVHGAISGTRPFTPADTPAPHNPYAVSKLEAELGLQELASRTGLELVIVRPPLVYGPDAPGNFRALIQLLDRGLPLPLGAIHNRRSLVAIDNLVDLLLLSLRHSDAAGRTFLVSDGEDLSTTELVRRTAQALGRPARLLAVPSGLMSSVATLLGRRDMAQQLFGSLQVDIASTRRMLGWAPIVSVDSALRATAQHFLQSQRQ